MGTIEDKIARQRKASAERIKRLYPDECARYEEMKCIVCGHWLWIEKTPHCKFDLAPVTSALLPCPYYTHP